MKQFIEDQGWVFSGNCGCRNNMNVYRSSVTEWSSYEVWMNLNSTRLEIRRRFGRDTKVLGVGYPHNFPAVYTNNLPAISA